MWFAKIVWLVNRNVTWVEDALCFELLVFGRDREVPWHFQAYFRVVWKFINFCWTWFVPRDLWVSFSVSRLVCWVSTFSSDLASTTILFIWSELMFSTKLCRDVSRYIKSFFPYMSYNATKQTKWECAQQRLRSAWESAQSDQSLRCSHGNLPSLIRIFAVRMTKAWVLSYPLSAQRRLIRLGGCPGWSESSLFSSCRGSIMF